MKPLRNEAIVKVDVDEKETHTTENGTKIFIAKSYSWNGNETNPTSGILLHDHMGVSAGTKVHFGHRATEQGNELQLDEFKPLATFSIESSYLFFYEDEDGELVPFDNCCIAERIYEPERVSEFGIILDSEPKQIKNRVVVKKAPKSWTDVKDGDVVVIYPYADAMININYKGRDTFVIRVRYDDIQAVDHTIKDFVTKSNNDNEPV